MSLDLTRTADGFSFTWAQWSLLCSLSRFKDSSQGTHAELTIYSTAKDPPRLLTQGMMNLSALQTRDRLVSRLAKLLPDLPWDTVIETVCVRGMAVYREGEPWELLTPQTEDRPARFLLNPLLYHGHPTLFYGPGDSGKSFLALYLACLAASGGEALGLSVKPDGHRVLYCNWEMRADEMRLRTKLLVAAHPSLVRFPFHRFCYQPLTEFAPDLRREIQAQQIEVIVIDSLALASGGEIERSEAAIRFFAALTSLDCTSLVIGHVAKGVEEHNRTPYGSVFFFNLARSVWEVRKTQEENDGLFKIALFHRKNNLGRKLPPMGYSVTVSESEAAVSQFNPSDEPEFSSGIALHLRIALLLKDGEARTVQQIAEDIDAPEETVRKTLNRYKGKKWYCVTHGGGRGKEAEWARLDI